MIWEIIFFLLGLYFLGLFPTLVLVALYYILNMLRVILAQLQANQK